MSVVRSPSGAARAAALLVPVALAPVIATLVAACAQKPSVAGPAPDSTASGRVGTVEFPTSGGAAAQQHFLRGVTTLHSFGYKQARSEFQKAQELEPGFAMAYWGEALGYNHPLLPEQDVDSPRAVLKRLGKSREERAAKAPTQREKDFLDAVEVLFGEGDTAQRRIAYMEAMRRMHESYPGDDEVAAFYALSLLGAVGPLHDDTYRLAVEAGAVALEIFGRNPDHPGAAHYVIHAFDDPIHAPLALPAAYRFAEIAPAVSHARHMPSHIFIQRGMWDRVSSSNDSAFAAAQDQWESGDSVADLVHSLDWGHYGDLQRGDHEKTRRWMAELDRIVKASDGASRAVETVPLLRARWVIETEEWEARPVTDESADSELLATGLSAARTGDLALARQAAERLAELASKEVSDTSTFQRGTAPIAVAQREVAALLALREGATARALELLDQGVELAAGMGPPRGAASPVKPVHELYGEVLLELGRPADAEHRFEASLLLTPNRPRSLLGLARARAANGDPAGAADAYRRLVRAREERDLPDVQEARRSLGSVPS